MGEGDSEQYDDSLDPTMEIGDEDTLPVPKPFADGLIATGMRRYDSETKKVSSRVASSAIGLVSGVFYLGPTSRQAIQIPFAATR